MAYNRDQVYQQELRHGRRSSRASISTSRTASSGLRRPVRLRQVHAAAHDRRARGDHLRRPPDRRPARQRRAAGRARHRHGVPVLRALPAHDACRQHGFGLKMAGVPKAGAPRQGRARRRRPAARRAARPQAGSFRAASASASRSAAPSCASRRSSCSTSRCRTSTPPCACRCASSSRACTTARRDHDLRHPRPGRGDDAGRPDRGAERPASSSRSARRSSSTTTRRNLFVAGFIGSPEDELPAATARRRARRRHRRVAGRPLADVRCAAGMSRSATR